MTKLVKVLVVDDEPSVARVTALNLQRLGCAVVEYYSAIEALDYVRDGKSYDVLIVDQVMPVMAGTELVEKIVELFPEHRRKKIFIYSGNATEEQVGLYAALVRKPASRAEWQKLLFEE